MVTDLEHPYYLGFQIYYSVIDGQIREFSQSAHAVISTLCFVFNNTSPGKSIAAANELQLELLCETNQSKGQCKEWLSEIC